MRSSRGGSWTRRRIVLTSAGLGAALVGGHWADVRGQATPEPVASDHLISVDEARKLVGHDGFRPVALVTDPSQADGFIPESQLVDWHELELLDTIDDAAVTGWADNMSALFSRLDLSRDDAIVIYDDGSLFAPMVGPAPAGVRERAGAGRGFPGLARCGRQRYAGSGQPRRGERTTGSRGSALGDAGPPAADHGAPG